MAEWSHAAADAARWGSHGAGWAWARPRRASYAWEIGFCFRSSGKLPEGSDLLDGTEDALSPAGTLGRRPGSHLASFVAAALQGGPVPGPRALPRSGPGCAPHDPRPAARCLVGLTPLGPAGDGRGLSGLLRGLAAGRWPPGLVRLPSFSVCCAPVLRDPGPVSGTRAARACRGSPEGSTGWPCEVFLCPQLRGLHGAPTPTAAIQGPAGSRGGVVGSRWVSHLTMARRLGAAGPGLVVLWASSRGGGRGAASDPEPVARARWGSGLLTVALAVRGRLVADEPSHE